MFGGSSPGVAYAKLWRLDTSVSPCVWSLLSPARDMTDTTAETGKPRARGGHSATVVRDSLYIFGGNITLVRTSERRAFAPAWKRKQAAAAVQHCSAPCPVLLPCTSQDAARGMPAAGRPHLVPISAGCVFCYLRLTPYLVRVFSSCLSLCVLCARGRRGFCRPERLQGPLGGGPAGLQVLASGSGRAGIPAGENRAHLGRARQPNPHLRRKKFQDRWAGGPANGGGGCIT